MKIPLYVNWCIADESIAYCRPHYFTDCAGYYAGCLNHEIHCWMKEQNIKYSLEKDDNAGHWYISFQKITDIVLFKLTWC